MVADLSPVYGWYCIISTKAYTNLVLSSADHEDHRWSTDDPHGLDCYALASVGTYSRLATAVPSKIG